MGSITMTVCIRQMLTLTRGVTPYNDNEERLAGLTGIINLHFL